MKKVKLFCLIAIALLSSSCAQDIVDVTGGITGIVKDYTTGKVIENCQVSLSPTGNTVVTNAEGRYTFKSLQVGTYTLTFTKIGYKDQSTSVEVVAGQSATRDIQLEAMGSIDFTTSILDFGESNTNMSFGVKNNTSSKYDINIVTNAEWLSFSQTRATISANNQLNITAFVDRSKVGEGTYNTMVTLEYTGSTTGNVVMQVRMVKAQQGKPSVETRNAYDITASSFKIGGIISSTGGSVVTSYGHCWSTNPNPTINNQHTDYGRTTETMSFNSSINQNLVNTIIYVRAYATNANGTAYGNEVQVTSTSTAPEDTGDFAGGTGGAYDPYQLRTAKHMQNMRSFPSAYFKMIADIDMDGVDWIPFELTASSFNGDNHTLYNLKISPYVTTDNQGLFSKLTSASVENLTINGVEIHAPSYSNIGAIAGSCSRQDYGADGHISNCHVILKQANAITGNQKVGGLVGDMQSDMTNCSVSSNLTASVVVGNSWVGGAVGSFAFRSISNVIVNCNISCGAINNNANAGGIVGYLSGGVGQYGAMSKCAYSGQINGLVSGGIGYGGITGRISGGSVTECKANVVFAVSESCCAIGGIAGKGSSATITACYSQGEVQGSVNTGQYATYGVAGITDDEGTTINHCYTLMNLGVTDYGSAPTGSFSIKDLVSQYSSPINVAEIMRAANSQYASYWNYDNTWTWTGYINGQSITATCPKLAWE